VASRDDLVVIHFSGHGFQGADDDGDETDGVDEFLVLKDSRESAKEDTALRDDEFGRFLDRIESDHVLILFDSCYSGGQARSLPSGARPTGTVSDTLRDFAMEGRLLLSAASETQEAFESAQLEHGVFTHFVLAGLAGAADMNEDDRITAWELYEYVSAEVPAFVRRERQTTQQPQLIGEGDTRVLVGLNPVRPEVGFSFSPTIPFAAGAVRFHDESTPAESVVSWAWSFGDGATASGRHPDHIFADPGSYEVSLMITLDNGQTASHRIAVAVSPAGRVERVEAASARAVISLGARNGVEIGDRFAVVTETGEQIAELRVIEQLDANAATCEISRSEGAIQPGNELRPLP
jgi:hypothetical protein